MALEEECHQDKTEKHWVQELRKVKEEEITWRAPWVFPQSIMYRCGDYACVPLLGLWGNTSYAPLLVLRQFQCQQFIPFFEDLGHWDFQY